MTGNDRHSIDSWTAYWRTGTGASCFEGPEVELRLAQVWNEYVDALPDGARILDLATGNGTVAKSCAARARARGVGLEIEAVDAAEIDPPRCVPDPDKLFSHVRFRSAVRLEDLPFGDREFDGVVSQFGFEYADEERATAEAARVLAPGGRLRLVVHARDGAVSRDIGRRLERLRSVLADNGPLSLVRALARAAEAGNVAAVNSMSTHLAAAAELTRRLGVNPPPDDSALFYSREFLSLWAQRSRYWPKDLRASVEQGFANANGVAIRQEQMLTVARSEEDIERMAGRFGSAGLTLGGVDPIRDERRGVQIAWLLEAAKPPALETRQGDS